MNMTASDSACRKPTHFVSRPLSYGFPSIRQPAHTMPLTLTPHPHVLKYNKSIDSHSCCEVVVSVEQEAEIQKQGKAAPVIALAMTRPSK